MGARRTAGATTYIAWISLLDAPPLALALLVRRRGRLLATLAPCWRSGLAGGVMSVVAYGIVLFAMRRIPIAHVVALRETSVIAATAIGARWLGEPFGRPRLVAATVVATGAALMRLAG
jgi:drug/metabolite transporter (DMT)-like permease